MNPELASPADTIVSVTFTPDGVHMFMANGAMCHGPAAAGQEFAAALFPPSDGARN